MTFSASCCSVEVSASLAASVTTHAHFHTIHRHSCTAKRMSERPDACLQQQPEARNRTTDRLSFRSSSVVDDERQSYHERFNRVDVRVRASKRSGRGWEGGHSVDGAWAY